MTPIDDSGKPNPLQTFLFYCRVSYAAFDHKQKATGLQKKNTISPNNLPAAVFTDMQVSNVHFPWEAYTLDESFFWTHNISIGNHLTVVLNHPANLNRVQVMMGSIVDGRYALEKGWVELG
ncbi:hypothetical protein P7K49_014514 [Saguinus oedipus]|uniref:Uncharacterized protein n=1 Tax=Saguinus oedipus TaxID=9490 RepID=A0ABQ9VIZ4_SAGOE|nr:hypothetical protein P7K49_014514 [Saguinus oedipus]